LEATCLHGPIFSFYEEFTLAARKNVAFVEIPNPHGINRLQRAGTFACTSASKVTDVQLLWISYPRWA